MEAELLRLVWGEAAACVSATLAERAAAGELDALLGDRVATGQLEADAVTSARLVRAHREAVMHELLVWHRLGPVLAAFVRRSIPSLLWKGAALARTLYPRPGQRTMSDVDVLVPRSRWREAIALARDAGMELHDTPARPLTARFDYVRALCFADGATLEIHRAFSPWPQFGVEYADVFARSRREADGLLVPDPVDHFVALAIHAVNHGLALPLRSFADGWGLIVGGHVAPEAVTARAAEWHARRATAVWIEALVRLGLDAPEWRAAARTLGLDRQATDVLDEAKTHGATVGVPYAARVLRLLDDRRRQCGWLLHRVCLHGLDALVARPARSMSCAA